MDDHLHTREGTSLCPSLAQLLRVDLVGVATHYLGKEKREDYFNENQFQASMHME